MADADVSSETPESSPLAVFLLVIGEPFTLSQKELILKRVAKGRPLS